MKGLMWEGCEVGECKECEEGWVVKSEGWEERSGVWVPKDPGKWVWPRGLVRVVRLVVLFFWFSEQISLKSLQE